MGVALDSIIATKLNITGSGFENLVAAGDSSFSIRSYVEGSKAYLEEIYGADNASDFQLSIKSPRLHDQVRGILISSTSLDGGGSLSFNPQQLQPGLTRQRLYSTDVLQWQVSGTANDDVVFVGLVYYENLGGVSARLASWAQVEALMVNEVGILVQPISSATAGTLGTGVTLNSVDSRLKANTDYALLGATVDELVTSLFVQGTDTGNLKVPIPGSWDNAKSATWFPDLSLKYNVPHIPIINSNNQGSTLIYAVDVLASANPNVTLMFAELETYLSL